MRNFGQSSGAELALHGARDAFAYGRFDATGMIMGSGAACPPPADGGRPVQQGGEVSATQSQWQASLARWQG